MTKIKTKHQQCKSEQHPLKKGGATATTTTTTSWNCINSNTNSNNINQDKRKTSRQQQTKIICSDKYNQHPRMPETNITFLTRNSSNKSYFPRDVGCLKSFKIKQISWNNSQGVVFVPFVVSFYRGHLPSPNHTPPHPAQRKRPRPKKAKSLGSHWAFASFATKTGPNRKTLCNGTRTGVLGGQCHATHTNTTGVG